MISWLTFGAVAPALRSLLVPALAVGLAGLSGYIWGNGTARVACEQRVAALAAAAAQRNEAAAKAAEDVTATTAKQDAEADANNADIEAELEREWRKATARARPAGECVSVDVLRAIGRVR